MKGTFTPPGAPILDTISTTLDRTRKGVQKSAKTVSKVKTDQAEKTQIYKRAKRKTIAKKLAPKLSLAAEHVGDIKMKKAYWNTYYCMDAVIKTGDVLSSSYCRNRWCPLCSAIRTAHYIQRYIPIIKHWEDAHLVTLTVPNCKDYELADEIEKMYKTFTQIKDMIKKRHRRNPQSNKKLVGLRKLEVTYNARRNDYHPHYHFITENLETADALESEWLKRYDGVSAKAQDVRRIDDIESGSKEVFKYFTKVIHDVKTTGGKTIKEIHAFALHNIFAAIRGRRIFQSFGFKSDPPEFNIVVDDGDSELSGLSDGVYIFVENDWVNVETGEVISGYQAPERLMEILTNNIIVYRPKRLENG